MLEEPGRRLEAVVFRCTPRGGGRAVAPRERDRGGWRGATHHRHSARFAQLSIEPRWRYQS
eukprot:6938974-Prorocentrum_lima.AAC.1